MQQRGLELGREIIDESWLNAAGHMRASGHVVLFEAAVHRFFAMVGLAELTEFAVTTDADRHGPAPFLAEMHVCYRNEVGRGDHLLLSLRVLGVEARRLTAIMTMHVEPDLDLAATCELDIVCMDLTQRTSAPWPPGVHEQLTALRDAHAKLALPAQSGRAIRPCAG